MGLFDLIFGKSKPKYPKITNEMLQPIDATLSTTDAKRIIKEVFRQVGYCEDATEARMEAESLGDSIRYHEENLRSDLEMIKEEYDRDLAEWKSELQDLKDDIKTAEPGELESTKEEIALHNQYKPDDGDYLRAKKALADFKADKRAFLISYINEHLHGIEAQTGDA